MGGGHLLHTEDYLYSSCGGASINAHNRPKKSLFEPFLLTPSFVSRIVSASETSSRKVFELVSGCKNDRTGLEPV